MAGSERDGFFGGEEIVINEPISKQVLCELLRIGYPTLAREVISRHGIRLIFGKHRRIAPEQANLIVQLTAQARAEGRISPIRDSDSQGVSVELR